MQRGNAAAVIGTMGGTSSPLISFLDCLFLLGVLSASPLTDCLFSTYLLHYMHIRSPVKSCQYSKWNGTLIQVLYCEGIFCDVPYML